MNCSVNIYSLCTFLQLFITIKLQLFITYKFWKDIFWNLKLFQTNPMTCLWLNNKTVTNILRETILTMVHFQGLVLVCNQVVSWWAFDKLFSNITKLDLFSSRLLAINMLTLKGSWTAFVFILYWCLSSTYNVIKIFYSSHIQVISSRYVIVFWPVLTPLIWLLCLNRRDDCRFGSRCPLLWLANSCECLKAHVLHRCGRSSDLGKKKCKYSVHI